MATTTADIVTDAMTEIRVARAGDVPSPEDMDYGVRVFNRLLDLWNADGRAVYGEGFTDFTLTTGLNPHTIGPGGTFSVAVRPVDLLDAQLNLGGSPAVFRQIDVQDSAWYAALPVPALTNSIPTDVYYSADWPLGKLYFWGVPTTAYGVRLWLRTLLAALAVTDTFSLPPGYQEALTLTLAERLAPGFGQSLSQITKENARNARALIKANNDEIPRISTVDSGMPGPRSGGGGFNWLNRSIG